MLPVLSAPLRLDDNAQDLLFREARTANAFTDEPVLSTWSRPDPGSDPGSDPARPEPPAPLPDDVIR